jgi:hypothetical protein
MKPKVCLMYATDEYPGMQVMDVGDFEDLAEQVSGPLRNCGHQGCANAMQALHTHFVQVKDHLYSSKRVFIHDGVIGSDRNTQTRVRIVTDSPDIALFASNMLVSGAAPLPRGSSR